MSLIDKAAGNATEGDRNLEVVRPILMEDVEVVEISYNLAFRDSLVFTNLRLIHVDRQGMTGKKIRTTSIPWKKISWFSVENAGRFDLDAELDVKVHGEASPQRFRFGKNVDLSPILKTLGRHVLTGC
eukprot:CAMPEP_0184689650 /NCGR_PEP_ID=MMETSP0312-20130426/30773_1 /TAXON_ID=31354 /ORGANISM="Compsopogon coeruleus, Strain SAG 36.94" /LENGTH=127 /DNA_ID=CAMNT_0027147027 /DNA_START=465 /DNA_END=848 /DNA_ORIENTATION=-